MKSRALGAFVAWLLVAACDDDPKRGACSGDACAGDAGDAGVSRDASLRDATMGQPGEGGAGGDAAPEDAGEPPGDAGALPDAGAPPCNAATEPALPPLALTPVVTGRDRLVFAAQPPGASDWYLVHQKGRIDVLSAGEVRAQPFLDLSEHVAQNLSPNDERGLLGLAFAPDYATSGAFYVALTPNRSGDANENRDLVLAYQRSSDPYVADASSRKEILALEPSAGNHNGGHVVFGPDGMLYVGTGDGGGGCNNDKPGAPQDRSSLFGKILRLDPRAPAPHAAAGNPFSGASGDARVLHYGLRNPFRFGFDAQNGDLYIGDVGQISYEEVSLARAGEAKLNFGWAAFEGDVEDTCPGRALREGDTHTPPIVHIDRRMAASQGSPFADYVSIIAGPVYRGAAIPELQGVFLFGDYTGRRMGALRQCGAETSPVAAIRKMRDANSGEAYFALPAGESFSELTAIVRDDAGELYFVANRSSLLKLVPRP